MQRAQPCFLSIFSAMNFINLTAPRRGVLRLGGCLILAVLPSLRAQEAIRITGFEIVGGNAQIVFETPEQDFNRFTLQEALNLPATWTQLPDAAFSQIDGQRFRFVVPVTQTDRSFFSIVGALLTTELDADGDGLPAALESILGTNANLFDSDDDGYSDGVEYNFGTDPRSQASVPDLTVPPRASFALAQSSATEGAGPANVIVRFDRPYFGELKFRVLPESTAVAGVDYTTLPTMISVAGTTATIPLSWVDDDEISPLRVLFLELVSDPALPYARGGQTIHTVMLGENDAWWTGVLVSELGQRNFRLKRTSSNGVASAAFAAGAGLDGLPMLEGEVDGARSDQSAGVIPVGDFPALVEFDTAAGFLLSSAAMPAPTSGLLGAHTGLTRTLTFVAQPDETDPNNRDDISPVRIIGRFTERLCRDDGSVCAEQTGDLILVRQAPTRPNLVQ
jgi:hypothetical protein